MHIIVFAPPDDINQDAPRGFTFVDGVFQQARMKDPISTSQMGSEWLRRKLNYLVKRYPKRIQVAWVNPLSLQGIIFSIRFRQRKFPGILLLSGSERQFVTGDDLANIEEKVVELLSKPSTL